jgi:NAD-dependent deacetylase
MSAPATKIAQAAEWLRQATRVVVFTGAGASAESGIPTFRDQGGVWDRFSPEQFATPQGLWATSRSQPRLAAEFVLGLLEPIAAACPNGGHRAIAELERHLDVTVVTQNIDGLHQEASSSEVWEVHGSVFEIVTSEGDPLRRLSRRELGVVVEQLRRLLSDGFDEAAAWQALGPILGWSASGFYRPNIVLFGEPMAEPAWTRACQACDHCECLLAVGTSGVVYPAAMLPEQARSVGAKVITISPEPAFGEIWLDGTAAGTLPMLVAEAYGKARVS